MEVRSVAAIVKSLNDARVQYLIVGGVAVVAHGYERLTKDLDLVIGLERENIIRGLRALMATGYHMRIPVTPEQFADPELRKQWRREKNMVELPLWSDLHRRTPVDIFVYEPFDFAKEYAASKREKVMANIKAPVISLKTLLKMKRAAGRPQDLADIADLERIEELKKEFSRD
jgi:predicted nucleotidyltransferase